MGSYFIATRNGNGADGYLVADGQIYRAQSGPWERGYLPEGSYNMQDPAPIGDSETSLRPGNSSRGIRKFRLVGVGPRNAGLDEDNLPAVDDPRYPGDPRTRLLLHYDGGTPGTEGCVGYKDVSAQDALSRAIGRGERDFHVIYVNSDREAQNLAQLYAYNNTTIPPVPATNTTPSRNRRGRRVQRGASNVLVGQQQREMAHVTSPLDGGVLVSDGSPNVFVTPGQFRTARIDDMTTDGSPVADGVESVQLG